MSTRLIILLLVALTGLYVLGQPAGSQEPASGEVEQEMIFIPAGSFLRGTAETEKNAPINEVPQYAVTLAAFYIDKYEVTNAMYKKFVDETGHKPPQHWVKGEIPLGKENHPVVYVSWEDASAYARWAGKRLPTEAEWERAARGADGRKYPWGDEFDKLKCRSAESNIRDTAEVTEYENGKSPEGCYNMAGNVWEWVQDRYDWCYYKRYLCPEHGLQPTLGTCQISVPEKVVKDNVELIKPRPCGKKITRPDNNPTGPADDEKVYLCPKHGPQIKLNEQGKCPVEGCQEDCQEQDRFPERVVRGGSWADKPEDLRSARRGFYPPDYTSFKIGFRCAKDAK